MTAPRLRLRIRSLLALVALCACGSAAWVYLSPQERWRRAIHDPDTLRWYDANEAAFTGQVWGIDDQSAVAELASALGDRDSTVRVNAAVGLAWFGVRAAAAAPALIAATRDPEGRVRSQAIFSLLDHQVAPPNTAARDQAVRAAIRALADPDKMVRIVAAQSLAEVGHGDEALPVLLGALKENDLEIGSRRRAMHSLGRMGPKAVGAIPALLEAMREDIRKDDPYAPYLRVQAAAILVHLGAAGEALPILQGASEDENQGIRQLARLTLERYESERSRVAEPESLRSDKPLLPISPIR